LATLQARLVWTRQDGSRVEFPLSKPVMLVGRDPESDIPVQEALVSWAHARLEQRADAWVVQDLGSTNLTKVNGEAVAERPLRHGDEVRFARAVCQFLLDPGPDVVAGGV
jgi:pSer/pThr/pTyr-binding forkhead associated (FHA) protein